MKLNVVRVGNDGEGIAFKDNKPVFIYYAYKNEEVLAEVFKNKRGALEGKLSKVITPSKQRVNAPCPYYEVCGGCNLMHINYLESLKYKKEVIDFLVNTKLKKETLKTVISNTHPSDDVFNYRNKINVPVKVIDGKNAIGLFYRGTNNFLKIDSCMVEDDNLNQIAREVLLMMDKHKIDAYDNKKKSGYITNLSIRANLKGEMQLSFILKNRIDLTKLSDELMKRNKNLISIYQSYNPDYKTNRDMFDGKLTHLKGEEKLEMTLDKYKFYVTPSAFFQLNTKQALKLYDLVVKKAEFKKTDIVLDAYSGVGTIATFISPHVKEVVAVESIKAAVVSMEESNKINNITNMKTIAGDAIKVTEYLKQKFDVMVFDPPRLGLGEKVVNYILRNKPRKVVYVSCNPKTLVEDLKLLATKYDIISIDPFDMFPQTSQVESITVLTLKKGK